MSTTANQSGADLEVLEDQSPDGTSPTDEITHLHFDRRARAWRAHPTNVGAVRASDDEQDIPELRSA
jgi:hypothetical protein